MHGLMQQIQTRKKLIRTVLFMKIKAIPGQTLRVTGA
jgi:hypothetical protein